MSVQIAIAAVLLSALVFGGAGLALGRRLFSKPADPEAHDKLSAARDDVGALNAQLRLHNSVIDALKSEQDLWSLHPARRPEGYFEWTARAAPQTLLIANLKGGVGKTTLAANLAAYFDQHERKRVLLVDMDYQGSLSNMVAQAASMEEVDSQVDRVLEGRGGGDYVLQAAHAFPHILPRTRLLSAQYPLTRTENRLLIEWAFETGDADSRFNLASALMSDAVTDAFDVVIIDGPPRLSFSMINALAASTHLLVPTALDGMSVEAVGNFLSALNVLKDDLNPAIELLGVVGTLAPFAKLSGPQLDAVASARNAAATWGADAYLFDAHIPRRQPIAAAAGRDIAYLRPGAEGEEMRALFGALGDEVRDRLGLKPHVEAEEEADVEEAAE